MQRLHVHSNRLSLCIMQLHTLFQPLMAVANRSICTTSGDRFVIALSWPTSVSSS